MRLVLFDPLLSLVPWNIYHIYQLLSVASRGGQGGGAGQLWGPGPSWICWGDRAVADLPPPPPLNFPILKTYAKVCVTGTDHPPPLGMWMTSHGQCPRGGVLVNVQNVQEWGCFTIFRRADDVTRTMSKGCVLVNVFTPPFRKSCIRACRG